MIEELPGGITLVGTAHVAASSVREVEQAIRGHRPRKVLVELDPRRLEALRDPEAWQKTDIVRVIREGKQHLFLLQLYLASVQARMGRETGVAPGAELLRAVQVADEVGAEVQLIDRDIAVTLKRGFAGMGFWERLGLGANVVMELMPAPAAEAPPAGGKPRRTDWGAAVPFALMALLLFAPSIAARASGLAGRLFDAALGVANWHALTALLVGAAAGLLAGALVPRPGVPLSRSVEPAAWCGLLAGFLAQWAWSLSDGLSAGFLAEMWPWADLPRWASASLLAAFFVAGTTLAFRFVLGWRRFAARRQAVVGQAPADVEAMLRTDMISRMTDEFALFAPRVKRALIDERDDYMASHIAEAAGAGAGPIVAVVGAGHLPGIRARLAEGLPPPPSLRKALDEVPRKRVSVATVIGWAIPLSIVAFFVYLAATGRFAELREQALAFILITGGLSALGCLVAFGHPLSVLVAFLAAPIGVLHPALATGWFSGLTQAWVRKPTVADFQAVKHIESLRQFWANGVARVLLVTAFTNVGAMVSTAIVIPRFFSSLTGGG